MIIAPDLKATYRIIFLSKDPIKKRLSLLWRFWKIWITEPCRMYSHLEVKPVPGEGINCDLCIHRGGWLRCDYSRTTPDPMADLNS